MRAAIAIVLGMVLAAAPASGASGWWRPETGIEWDIQFAISAGTDLTRPTGPIDAIDLDGSDTPADIVATLHERDIRVLCYVNAGAWEAWRPDADLYPATILGEDYPGWPGERFVDIRALEVLGPILEVRFDECADKGFDAIDPDNIDTAYTDTGFPLTESDQLTFNRWLSDQAHARGLAIFQKNVPELTPDLVDAYDGAVTEDCAADRWCGDLRPYLDANKPVLAIEYTDVTDAREFARMCTDPELAGLSLILKNRDLDESRVACDGSS